MAQPCPHLLHGLHQLTDLVAASHLDRGAQIPRGDLLRHTNHTAQRAHDQAGNHPGRHQPDQQRQCRGTDDQQRVLFQFGLHGPIFGRIGLVHSLHHLVSPLMQLLVDGLFLLQQSGVLSELVTETGDVTGHFIEHGTVAFILDRGFKLLGLGQCLTGLFDLALPRAVVTLAALVQTHTGFIHGLQHQARHLADLIGLFDELRTVLAFGVLQGIGAVIGETGLQHIKIVGHAGHRPTGHFQRQVLGLTERNELVESLAVSPQGLLDVRHDRHIGRRLRLELGGQGDQPIDPFVQGIGGFRITAQGVFLLQQSHLQQTAVEQ